MTNSPNWQIGHNRLCVWRADGGDNLKCINPLLFLLNFNCFALLCFPLTLLGLGQLAILSLASVSMHTSAALDHPGRNSRRAGFLCFDSLKISTPIRPFSRRSHPFSSFRNLTLVQADVSFQLVLLLLILPV